MIRTGGPAQKLGGGSRFLTALRTVAQIVSFLACFQLSGMERGAVQILAAVEAIEVHCDDCEDDTPDDCAPGCPMCHCGSAPAVVLPPAVRGQPLAFRKTSQALPILTEGRAPDEPDLPNVYRPPRSGSPPSYTCPSSQQAT